MLAIINRDAGTAGEAERALASAGGFDVRVRGPAEIDLAVRAAVLEGHRRVVVVGGDGTLACAANVLAGTAVELAVVPGGTLNHFARDHGLPTDLAGAVDVARQGTARAVGVGRVNGRVFLSTSSVGAYVALVRIRDRIERAVGYSLASLIAASRVFLTMRAFAVEVATSAGRRIHRTPLVFIGVGERELKFPLLGGRVADGEQGLHVMVVHGRTRSAVAALAISAATRGLEEGAAPHLDAVVVDACTVTLRHPSRVALDGEVVRLASPLRYEYLPGALRLVVPAEVVGSP